MSASGILITGLRRSGTTVFWETFRKDPLVTCFDEPFHPRLWEGHRRNAKGTWTELGPAWDNGITEGLPGLAPIEPLSELEPASSREQREYLSRLFKTRDKVVIDVVRAWNRFPQLISDCDSPVVIHLVRNPVTWVTAHMLPPGSERWQRKISNIARELSFFSRRGHFNNWHYQDIVEEAVRTEHRMFRSVNISIEELKVAPAYVKLLSFWWAATRTTYAGLSALPKERVLTITLEQFVRDPATVMMQAYRAADWEIGMKDYAHLKPLRSGWKAGSSPWRAAFEKIGIPPVLLSTEEFSGSRLSEVLSSHDATTRT